MHRRLPTYSSSIDELRPFSKIRLIVADLDGSLVESTSSNLSESITKFRSKLSHVRYQIDFTVATGRTFFGAQRIINSLKLKKGVPYIIYNGSVIAYGSNAFAISTKHIPNSALANTLKIARNNNLTALAYVFSTGPSSKSLLMQETVYGWATHRKFTHEVNGLPVFWHTYDQIPEIKPSAILLLIPRGSERLPSLTHDLQSIDGMSVTSSGSEFLEIRPHGSNKGSALKLLAKHIEVQQNEILAIGDNDNDIEMLKWAGIGVGVAGSSPMAAESADFISDYDAVGGAIQVLNTISHARRYFDQSTRGRYE